MYNQRIIKLHFLFLFFLFSLHYLHAQEIKHKQYFAVCKEKKGCTFSEINISAEEVDLLLGKKNFWTQAPPYATLILNHCENMIEDSMTVEEINFKYSNSKELIIDEDFDLKKYLLENGCFAQTCLNETKKISFTVRAEGMSGSGYFYLNIKAGEAYMPNESFQTILAQNGAGEMINDQLIRNGKMENFVITNGKKYKVSMPIGIDMSKVIKNDAINANHFKNNFVETGQTRKHLNTSQWEKEYRGKDEDGNELFIWVVPSIDVCLPKGKFDAHGFYNLGYISFNDKTYLITEMKGNSVHIKLTDISNGSYNFNPTGYQPINIPTGK